MEVARRFGNHVGDPLAHQAIDARVVHTAGGFTFRNVIPTGTGWGGVIIAYMDGKRRGVYAAEPFFIPAAAGRRHYFELFLATPANSDENLEHLLSTIPGDRVEVEWTRSHTDQHAFRVYYTAGVTGTPARQVATFTVLDRYTGTSTAAVFRYVSPTFAAGGRSYQIRPIDRAGNEKTGCAVLTTVLSPWPLPPTGVEVHAYSAAAGLVTLKWSPASDQAGTSVYFVYKNAGAGGRIQYGTAVKSAASPFTTTGTPAKNVATFALGVTGAAAAGTWRAGVRHKNGGVEENNVSAWTEWVIGSSGAYAASYPRSPSFLEAVAKSGGRVKLRFTHDKRAEPAASSVFRIFRSPANSGVVNYGTVVTSVTRGSARFFVGTASVAGLTEGGVYKFGVRSETAGGTRETNTGIVATATPDATPPTSCPSSMTIQGVIG